MEDQEFTTNTTGDVYEDLRLVYKWALSRILEYPLPNVISQTQKDCEGENVSLVYKTNKSKDGQGDSGSNFFDYDVEELIASTTTTSTKHRNNHMEFMKQLLHGPVIEFFPEINAKFRRSVIDIILKNLITVLVGDVDGDISNTPRQDGVESFLDIFHLLNDVLDHSSRTTDHFNHDKNCLILLNILLNLMLTDSTMTKSTFLRLLLTVKSLRNYICCKVTAIEEIKRCSIDHKNFFLDLRFSAKVTIFFRFLLEASKDFECSFVLNRIISENENDSESSKLFALLVEHCPHLLDDLPELLEIARIWLNQTKCSNLNVNVKNASYILKNVAARLAEMDVETSVLKSSKLDTIMMRNPEIGQVGLKLINFWTEFFNLYEILDEKQSHLILPVLRDKFKIFNFNGHFKEQVYCWWLIILRKMLKHDNREIVKDGLLKYFSLGEYLNSEFLHSNERISQVLEKFLDADVLPLIRESIGWVLPDSVDFFNAAKSFGKLLLKLFLSNDLKIIEKIVGFVIQDGISPGPASTFFLIESMSYAVLDVTVVKKENEVLFINCISLLGQIVTQGLTAVDEFLRRKIEKSLFTLLITQMIPRMKRIETFVEFKSMLMFIGGLSMEALFHKEHFGSNQWNEFFEWGQSRFLNWKLQQKNKETDINSSVDNNALSSLFAEIANEFQTKGLLRIIFISDMIMKTGVGESGSKELPWSLKLFSSYRRCDHRISNFSVPTMIEIVKYISTKRWTHCENVDGPYDDELFESFYEKHNELISNILWDQHQPLNSVLNDKSAWSIFQNASVFEAQLELQLIVKLHKINFSLWMDIHSIIQHILTSTHIDCVIFETILWKLVSIFSSHRKFPATTSAFKLLTTQFVKPKWIQNHASKVFQFEDFIIKFGSTYKQDFLTSFYQLKFDGFASFLKNQQDSITKEGHLGADILTALIVTVIDNVDKAGFGGVVCATRCVRRILPYLAELKDELDHKRAIDLVETYVEVAWKLIFELRKSDAFWDAIKQFSKLIAMFHSINIKILEKFAKLMFMEGEGITGLPCPLIESIHNLFHSDNELQAENLEILSKICLQGLMYGAPLSKHNRVIFGLWSHLAKTESHLEDNETSFTLNAKIRILSIKALQFVLKSSENKQDMILRTMITEFNGGESFTPKKYFGNSILHRKKHRIAQAILILQPYFKTTNQILLIFESLMSSLCVESPQPSVRYLCEWILVRQLIEHEWIWEQFFNKSSKGIEDRIGFGSYFSSICLHVAKCLNNSKRDKSFFESSLKLISELMIGHHATVRVYSQTCFTKIFEILYKKKSWGATLIDKYAVLYDALQTGRLCGGNSAKIATALEKDFYIQEFHPVKHYSPEVIFVYLPRLSDVAFDELPLNSDETMNSIHLTNVNPLQVVGVLQLMELYESWEKESWHLKTMTVNGREAGDEFPVDDVSLIRNSNVPVNDDGKGNYQKKLNPWKTLSVSENMDQFSEKLFAKKKSAMDDGLIVVGSLVDRIPNLGGLCRSCEIFGVSKYVVPSLRVLDDQQFLNLSVSAHNWVDMIEVPPRDLESFLTTYASKGYTILGIEQAQESTRLNTFKFPKKSLLLLGNEKYGIPTNLLHLVDCCLEIPQVGVIRSLNVHVTGALCIWQYAQQHVIK